jgi:hypothetical protein
MALRPKQPGSERRLDLDEARRMVSGAEREALERAELLEARAESLLEAAARRAELAETEEVARLRAELSRLQSRLPERSGDADRRTAGEPERLEVAVTDLTGASGASSSPPELASSLLTSLMDRMSDDTERLIEAADHTAARLHSQAEIDLGTAREEAVRILAAATKEAEDLLTAAVEAIERDTAISQAARNQADRDAEAAAAMRREAEELLARAESEALARVDKAEREAEAVRDGARRDVEAVRAEARREALRATEEEIAAMKARFAAEVAEMRRAMDRASDTIARLLDTDMVGLPAGTKPG